MIETKKGTVEQLSLDLPSASPASIPGIADRGAIVCFVDASTLAIRRKAIERVRAAGIFPVPGGISGKR